MQEINRIVIPVQCRSLVWSGDELVDWVSGGKRITLGKKIIRSHMAYAYRFDNAIVSPSQEYVALYERFGTKGLLLRKNGKIIREINRSFYYAHRYEFPITFLTLPDGRTGIAHCPRSYAQLDIEDVESGECLTQRETPPFDYFHSRLSVSTDSRYLLNAGWIWHPVEMIQAYDLTQVYAQPAILDTFDERFIKLLRAGVDINNAAFLSKDAIIFQTSDGDYEPEEIEEDELQLLEPRVLAIYDLTAQQLRSCVSIQEPAGLLMPVGEDFVVGFYEHPKLIDLKTGKVIMKWLDIDSGRQNSSITDERSKPVPIAIDAANKRFAVASQEHITVIELG